MTLISRRARRRELINALCSPPNGSWDLWRAASLLGRRRARLALIGEAA